MLLLATGKCNNTLQTGGCEIWVNIIYLPNVWNDCPIPFILERFVTASLSPQSPLLERLQTFPFISNKSSLQKVSQKLPTSPPPVHLCLPFSLCEEGF